MAEWKITYRGIVYPRHCDQMGHMNVMWYAGKFDEACWQLLAMLGLHPSRFAQDGTGMAAVEQHIQYKRELHAGDAVTVQSALSEVKAKSIHMLHKQQVGSQLAQVRQAFHDYHCYKVYCFPSATPTPPPAKNIHQTKNKK